MRKSGEKHNVARKIAETLHEVRYSYDQPCTAKVMHFKNTFLMGHNSQEHNSVANKPTQLVCPVFLRFTVFPCLIARTI